MRGYECKCGFSAWATDSVLETTCIYCGRKVKTHLMTAEDRDKLDILLNKKSSKLKGEDNEK